jgi:hypothetical protein
MRHPALWTFFLVFAFGCNEVRIDRPMPPEAKELSKFPKALRGTWCLTVDATFFADSSIFNMTRKQECSYLRISKNEIVFFEDSLGQKSDEGGTLDSDTLVLKKFRHGWVLNTQDSHGWSPLYFSFHENSISLGCNDLSLKEADSISVLLNHELVMDSIGALGLEAFRYYFQIESNDDFYSSLGNEITPFFIMEKLNNDAR